MSTATWADLIDDFEAGLRSAERSLKTGTWDPLEEWRPPAKSPGPMTIEEAQRIRDLLDRTADLREKIAAEQHRMLEDLRKDRRRRDVTQAYVTADSMPRSVQGNGRKATETQNRTVSR